MLVLFSRLVVHVVSQTETVRGHQDNIKRAINPVHKSVYTSDYSCMCFSLRATLQSSGMPRVAAKFEMLVKTTRTKDEGKANK
jgi:hypothetical protein